jgi:uncharacterized protein
MAKRVSIFPLPGALLFPGLQLPLHLFEPRYCALVSDALARDRLIGMIQPREPEVRGSRIKPALFQMGCLGRIADVEALDEGRFNIILEGISLFRVIRELEVTTKFRQVEVDLIEPPRMEALAAVERAALENEAKRFAIWLGYRVDWAGVAQLDDTTMVNAIAQIAPFDAAAKQALLEAPDLSTRAELVMQLMRFASSRRDPDDNRATLQ